VKREAIEMFDGEWYPIVKRNWYHSCCDCLLTHKVDFKIIKGRLHTRWTTDKAETRYWRKRQS
jgi:hypothetical protein